MRCIFCKEDSSKSKSIEHIVPESLGNKQHTLPKGVVCDACNNYLAIKIEKRVLELAYFQSLRGRHHIENKKGKIPGLPGFFRNMNDKVSIFPDDSSVLEVVIENKELFDSISSYKELYIPIIPEPPKDNLNLSKLIGKIALEALALRLSNLEGWQDEFVKNEGLNQLRNFVRYGQGEFKIWPYNTRRIYDEVKIKFDAEKKIHYQLMNEFDFLIPDEPTLVGEQRIVTNLYFVIAIMGIEYTINMTNAGLDRYLSWILDNKNQSILYKEGK
ncbi:HNH endonuclease [uncultured Chitinophaga sp.]|uniref:HNH endonuclease n=1 Tax=uncultured Chitinophaga sp. TaxID=339340 RepID=UPI0025D342DD|nr:HNH endonuclease [uncultured Chitinophaga sp.]